MSKIEILMIRLDFSLNLTDWVTYESIKYEHSALLVQIACVNNYMVIYNSIS